MVTSANYFRKHRHEPFHQLRAARKGELLLPLAVILKYPCKTRGENWLLNHDPRAAILPKTPAYLQASCPNQEEQGGSYSRVFLLNGLDKIVLSDSVCSLAKPQVQVGQVGGRKRKTRKGEPLCGQKLEWFQAKVVSGNNCHYQWRWPMLKTVPLTPWVLFCKGLIILLNLRMGNSQSSTFLTLLSIHLQQHPQRKKRCVSFLQLWYTWFQIYPSFEPLEMLGIQVTLAAFAEDICHWLMDPRNLESEDPELHPRRVWCLFWDHVDGWAMKRDAYPESTTVKTLGGHPSPMLRYEYLSPPKPLGRLHPLQGSIERWVI